MIRNTIYCKNEKIFIKIQKYLFSKNIQWYMNESNKVKYYNSEFLTYNNTEIYVIIVDNGHFYIRSKYDLNNIESGIDEEVSYNIVNA